MENKVSEDIYKNHLQSISGVKFTRRQIDVMACLLHLWGDKDIARQIGISPNTVSVHLNVISEKLGCSGRRSIIGFIEKSGNKKIFQEYYHHLLSKNTSEEGQIKKEKLSKEYPPTILIKQLENTKKRKKLFLISLGILFLGTLYLPIKYFFLMSNNIIETVRSELPLPHDSVLLKRPKILKQIDKKLKASSNSISTVALVGIGGAGKTTLARQYAQAQSASVIWEINAETKESFFRTFISLANALAKNIKQKKVLSEILGFQNIKIQEEAILEFVRDNLKLKKNWILIFDNVKNLEWIKNYLPQNSKIWGQGKLIITTRDENVKNVTYLESKSVLKVKMLSPLEAFELFNLIHSDTTSIKKKRHKNREINELVENLPPFPLDVTIVAHYIRNKNVNISEYNKLIKKSKNNTEHLDKLFLKSGAYYHNTRFEIISQSFKKIIEINSRYLDILSVICMLDSQNIPLHFLKYFLKSEKEIDLFVYHLKKNGLVGVSKQKENPVRIFLSIHRSTQDMGLRFFKEQYPSHGKKISQKILTVISKINAQIIASRKIGEIPINWQLMGDLFQHYQHIKNSPNIQNIISKQKNEINININLTLAYLYAKVFSNLVESKKHFQKFLGKIKNFPSFSEISLAWILKDVGAYLCDLGELKEALAYCQQSLALSRKYKNLNILSAINLKIIGVIYSEQNEHEKSLSAFKAAFKKLPKNNDISSAYEISEIYEQLSSHLSKKYINRFQAKKAIEYGLLSIKTLKPYQNNFPQLRARICHGLAKHTWRLGQVYSRFGEYEKAKIYYQEAENIVFQRPGSFILKSLILTSFGEIHLRAGDFRKASEKFKNSQKIRENILHGTATISWYTKLLNSELKIRSGQLESALKDYKEILNREIQVKDNYSKLMYNLCFYHLAIIYLRKNDFDNSIFYFEKFLNNIKYFCKEFFNEKELFEIGEKNIFIREEKNSSTNTNEVKECIEKSHFILERIFGKSHAFILHYVNKNNLMEKKL